MGLHRFFHGDRIQCARYYPFAKRKLDELRAFMKRQGLRTFTRKFDNSLGDAVRIRIAGSEEIVEIRAGAKLGFHVIHTRLAGTSSADNHRDVFSSRNTRIPFRLRGTAGVPQLSSGSTVNQTVGYLGPDGRGVAPVFLSYTDDNGAFRLALLKTRDFLSFNEVYDFGYLELNDFIAASVVSTDDGIEESYGVVDATFNGEYPAVLYTRDGGESWSFFSFSLGAGYDYKAPRSIRFGPESVWILFTAHDDSGNNHSFVVYTTDNGRSWEVGDSGGILADLGSFNISTDLVTVSRGMDGVRLDDGQFLVAARSYLYGDEYQVRVYRASSIVGPFSLVATFQLDTAFIDNTPADEYSATMFMVQGVPVYAAGNAGTGEMAMYRGDANGTSWVQCTLPATMHYSRISDPLPQALDENTIITGAHDGTDYVLYASADIGDTWERRAVIMPQAPDPTDDLHTYTRILGIGTIADPGYSFPGQPWIGDNRITPPWEAN